MKENRCFICGTTIPKDKTVCSLCEKSEPRFDTIKVTMLLDKIADISEFVSLASKCSGDVVAKSGNFAVSAKSIMGLVSLDLTKPIGVEFYGEVPENISERMKKFIVG